MAAAFGALAMFLAGCASSLGSGTYGRGEVGVPARIEPAVVLGSRAVTYSPGGEGVIGGATGAVIGGIAGSQIGGGSDERAIAGVVGAVAGAIVGQSIDRAANTRQGVAYTVRLERTGETFEVVQGFDGPQPFVFPNGAAVNVSYGDRVRVVSR
jgi:outer membrane lipoprotein SlyB